MGRIVQDDVYRNAHSSALAHLADICGEMDYLANRKKLLDHLVVALQSLTSQSQPEHLRSDLRSAGEAKRGSASAMQGIAAD